MLKKVSCLLISLIFIIISGISVQASSTPEIHLELEYVDDYGWNAEYLNFKFTLAENALDDITQMLVYYSLDGVTYQPVINPRMGEQWDLLRYSYGESDNNNYVYECMNSATTPLKEFLSGEIDGFFVKTEFISDLGSQYTTAAKLERNTESIALPDYCTVEASYPRGIIKMFQDENGQIQTIASQKIEIPQGTTREQLLRLLPATYNMEVIIIEDGYNLLGELRVSYPINWNVPENLETFVPGEYSVKMGNTAAPPLENQLLKKGLQQYYFQAPSTEMPLHLNITVTDPDMDHQAPPPSDQEETGGAEENFGSGGNRGDVGSNDITLGQSNQEETSQKESNQEAANHKQVNQKANSQNRQTASNSEAQQQSQQKENSIDPDQSEIDSVDMQSVVEEETSANKEEDASEITNETSQEIVSPNRYSNTSPKYIVIICMISVAVSAGIAGFIFWRRSNLKI